MDEKKLFNFVVSPIETGIESHVTQPPAGPSRRRSAARSRNHERKHGSPMQWSESISDEPINMTKAEYSGNNDHSFEQAASPCNGCSKREASSTPDNLSAGTKDDDDEDDDDDPDKIDTNKYDPERLKAFNMFVRLFVDENLDRMIPISRQPKDKIQAIIDSCARQFPEFGERARKRIRTYLKSCRRNKRTRESTNWELVEFLLQFKKIVLPSQIGWLRYNSINRKKNNRDIAIN
ncbi:UNVERIFIED_CONTAM: Nol4l [Trichonephila clavipes]